MELKQIWEEFKLSDQIVTGSAGGESARCTSSFSTVGFIRSNLVLLLSSLRLVILSACFISTGLLVLSFESFVEPEIEFSSEKGGGVG